MTHSASALASGLEPMASTGSITGVADGSDRKIDLGLSQALGILNRQVLRAAVRVVN